MKSEKVSSRFDRSLGSRVPVPSFKISANQMLLLSIMQKPHDTMALLQKAWGRGRREVAALQEDFQDRVLELI